MPPATLKRLATEDGSVSPPATKRKVQATTTSMPFSCHIYMKSKGLIVLFRESFSQFLYTYIEERTRKDSMENDKQLFTRLQI